jgi:hypothetical protein
MVQILDVTSQIEKDYLVLTPESQNDTRNLPYEPAPNSRPENTSCLVITQNEHPPIFEESGRQYRGQESDETSWQPASPSFYTPTSMNASHSDSMSYSTGETILHAHDSPESLRLNLQTRPRLHSDFSEESVITSHSISELRRVSSRPTTRSPVLAENAAADLLALRYMPSQLSQAQSISMIQIPGMSKSSAMPPPMRTQRPDARMLECHGFDDPDGVFLPGSAYQELHSTLRDHLIYTARSNAPTRHGTPEALPDMGFFERGHERKASGNEIDGRPESNVSPQREYGMPECRLSPFQLFVFTCLP